ncbi:MAG TPA: ferritin family protein [Methylomusa anaerophila]|uniref:Rubrerythrin n=1 Tax=Methylomusa anaerophila TaxID=1930071 RepID=A0A348AP17_9FIRM|nr:ferritin family protein [Methylomusa anaerophila]BBB92815.1 rubrerythrin [Methylomusa anaerophila]HML90727.1 ferritin family protein [Methylomusa anaerophila]
MEKNTCDSNRLFSDLEGLRISMDIEARGRDFYKQAYERAEKKEHKELFLLLMNDEIHHLEKFTRLYNQFKENKAAYNDEYLFDADISRYLTVLAEAHIFPQDKSKNVLPELKSMADILKSAIQDEKDSILFYDALSKCAKFEEAKQVFNVLKAEEQTHVVKLREMFDGWA